MEIKKSDINALANKLEKFAKDLPEHDQQVLSWVLARANATGELSEGDLDSASGGLLSQDSVGISWNR